jgi:hypothetical protein
MGRYVGPEEPSDLVRARDDGPHWLATAGSGDVLAGLLGALLAAGLPTHVAAEVGVAVHGVAGEIASSGGPISAGSVLDALPAAVRTLLAPGSRQAGQAGEIGVPGPRLREWHA